MMTHFSDGAEWGQEPINALGTLKLRSGHFLSQHGFLPTTTSNFVHFSRTSMGLYYYLAYKQ